MLPQVDWDALCSELQQTAGWGSLSKCIHKYAILQCSLERHDHPSLCLNPSKSNRFCTFCIPTLLKMEFEGGESYWNFILIIQFLQSCFLNDKYSSSFHVIGKQMKIKYLRLASEELSTCQTEAAHVSVGMASLQKLRFRHHTCA